MYYNKVDISGVDTSSLTVLKEQEKMKLLKEYRAGDKSARDKLIKGNLRLVLSVIQKFTGRGENPDDLFQVGCIGLIKAIDNFNTELDVRFSTYAVPMISGELRRYLRDNTPIRISRSLRDLAYREDIRKIHAGKANMFLSPLFRNTLAGVSGATIELYDTDGSVGAAKGAGIGAGIYKDNSEAFASLDKLGVIEPDESRRSEYLQAYSRWKETLNKMINN